MPVSVEDYLDTSFGDGDREYIDGELQESNIGEIDRSQAKTVISVWFRRRPREVRRV